MWFNTWNFLICVMALPMCILTEQCFDFTFLNHCPPKDFCSNRAYVKLTDKQLIAPDGAIPNNPLHVACCLIFTWPSGPNQQN